MTIKRLLVLVIVFIFASLSMLDAATAKKPAKKPAAKPASSTGIQAAQPMPGQWADFDKLYYLGSNKDIVFTLKSASFTCSRLYFGEMIFAPNGSEKLLVLQFSLQNSGKSEVYVNWATAHFTVVDSSDNNLEGTDDIGLDKNKQRLDLYLKPAQKMECYTCIRVPNDYQAPKLIIKPDDQSSVLRYDLHGKVKGLEAPYADSKDTTGAIALPNIPAEKGKLYQGNSFDFTYDDIKFVSGDYGDASADEGYGWAVLSATIKNQAKEKQLINWATITPTLKGKSGTISFSNGVFASAEDTGGFDTYAEPSESVQVKYAFPVKNGAELKSFMLQETENGRNYVWDLGAVKAQFKADPKQEDSSSESDDSESSE